MKLRQRVLESIPKNKRVNLSAMLTSEYFFHRSIQIQMALNQDRILPRDYLIKKAKSKINTGQKKKIDENKNKDNLDSSYEANKEKDKKEIPDELEKILIENQKKFAIQNKKYQTLKEHNDVISGYWRYINKKTKKEKREILFKRYFSKNDKNMLNLYSEHLQRFCLNIFKSNPLLMRKKNAEMFFHYLSEFNKYYKDENKFIYIKQKIISFLEKLKDFLEYVKIKADSNLDSISKDIKIKNSKFVREMELKVKQDLKTLKEKRKIIDEKDIKESEKMINKTRATLKALFEDKTIFEDPSYFDPNYTINFLLKSRNSDYKNKYCYNYKNNSSMPNLSKENQNNYSPEKTAKMNSTISTGFYAPPDSNNNNNKKKSITDNVRFKKIKIIKSRRKTVSSVFHFGKKNENYFKDLLKNEPNKTKQSDTISINNKNFDVDKISGRESISLYIYNDNDKNKKKIQNNISTNNNNNNISSNRRSEEENILKILSNKSIIRINNIKKNSRGSSISINKDKDISRESSNFRKKSIVISDKNNSKLKKNTSELDIRNSDKKNINNSDKKEKNSISTVNINIRKSINYDIGKAPVAIIYEGIKDKQKINNKDVSKINNYLKKCGKKLTKNLKCMDIIRQAKIITDRLDIEKKTKKVFQAHLSYEQLQRLESVKEVNKKLYKLDIDYMNHIFDYKSKSSDSIQLYN